MRSRVCARIPTKEAPNRGWTEARMTIYNLSYDRKDVRYEVHYGDRTEVFTSPYITQLWSWLGNTMEPGDTLHWLPGE
ncbi:DUF7372 domain-containing protein [Acinetobacter baumannii]|uniref:DUF7372 domain-containing protein n=1 Tax=Acinetobacter baumannii TaxID=470 RepID=UPI003D201BB5